MILVIGAGPAGLLAAWHAARKGHEVRVVDAADAVGGLAGSFEVAGVRVDHGSHRLHPSIAPARFAELQSLLGSDLQVRPRNGRIAMGGALLRFPLRTGDLLRSLPFGTAVRMARDSALAPLRRPRADTYAEVVRAGLGPTVYGSFYGPYARKLWGLDGTELAGEVARRRIAASSPLAVARKLVRAVDPAKRTFLYPRRGFGQLTEALAGAALDAGATIDLRSPVTEIQPGQHGLAVRLGSGRSIHAAQVWSSAPLPSLASIVPGAPVAVSDAANRLHHRAMVLLYLVLDGPQWTPFDAHYLPDAGVVATRISEPIRYRDSGEDPTDRTVLCAEVPCDVGDDVWEASDEDLAARLQDELARIGLPLPPVRAVESRRVARLYPICRPGFDDDLATVEAWVAAQRGLVTFGRQGLFVADNTHHVLEMAADLAASAGTGSSAFDGAAWSAARERFQHFVVED